MTTLTKDMLVSLDDRTLRTIAGGVGDVAQWANEVVTERQVAKLSLNALLAEADIAISNQEFFEIEGLGTLTLEGLFFIKHSGLPLQSDGSKNGASWLKSDALLAMQESVSKTLDRIKAGKEAQGIKFATSRGFARTMFDPTWVAKCKAAGIKVAE